MDKKSNNLRKDTIEKNRLSDEEVQVFRIDELDFGGRYNDQEENMPVENQVNKTSKSKITNTKNKSKPKNKTKRSKKESKSKKNKKHKKNKEKNNKKNKQSKRNIALILGVLVLIAGGIFASWELYFSFDEYDPFNYIEIVEVGGDTQAYLLIEKDDRVLSEKESLVRELVEFAVPKNENLSIGDVREVNIILDKRSKETLKENKIRLSPLNMNYTLGNVTDLEKINVMDTLEIDYKNEGEKVRIDEIRAKISDLDLLDLLIFETTDKLLSSNDSFTVTIKDTKSLEDYLLENGYEIEEMKKDFVVEPFEYIPEKLSDLGDIEKMKEDALFSLESNLNENELLYENFQVKQICYTDSAENNENARDKNYGYEYSKGSLMFMIEYKQIEDDEQIFADVIGYTNIAMIADIIDDKQILEMNPLYENASLDMVKEDMLQNGFTCSKN